ncbi:hypothetical protein N0B44_16710 [Roseibacterium beibuensis]|uniref:hypothetical protein n=1 Tax=[Roseibacterium] beibuensis TaxID=1193142 RepID=UPI00217F1BE2|nr:hypothetical protein [Roseibacterium beibuensis]MCS6624560.1 hypothetical protein [Roseibacterium beibuensis]
MGGYFDGAKRFNLLDNSLALLALNLACVTGLTGLEKTAVPERFNYPLTLSMFLFGAVFAVLAVYYSVLNGKPLVKLMDLDGEWGDGPPAGSDWRKEAQPASLVAVVVASASFLFELLPGRVFPDYWAFVLLTFLVLLPLPLVWRRKSVIVGVGRAFLALLSLMAFVLAIGLPLVPAAVANAEAGAEAAAEAPAAAPDRMDEGRAKADALKVGVAVTDTRDPPGGHIASDPATIAGTQEDADTPSGEEMAPPAPAGVTPADIARLERQIGNLQGAFASAEASREVRVSLTDPRPPPVFDMPAAKVEILPPQVIQQTIVGEQGPVGPMWKCGPAWALPPWRCDAVPAPVNPMLPVP